MDTGSVGVQGEARKAPDVLLDMYFSEFTAEDDVALFLRCNLYHESDARRSQTREGRGAYRLSIVGGIRRTHAGRSERDRRRRRRPLALRVFVLPAVSEEGLPAMYAGADALVLPSRGEGWDVRMEAMAMGLALVATTERPDGVHDRGELLPRRRRARSRAAASRHFATHMWSQPSAPGADAGGGEDPEKASAKGARARREMAKRFSPAAQAVVVGAREDREEEATGVDDATGARDEP